MDNGKLSLNEKEQEQVAVRLCAFQTNQNLIEKELPPIRWYLDHFVPSEALIGLVGAPESGKTWLAMWFAIRMSLGKTPFDHFDWSFIECIQKSNTIADRNPVPVLIIEEEMSEIIMQDRAKLLFECNKELPIYWLINEGFKITDKIWLETIKTFIKEKGIKVVFIDPFVAISEMKSENDNAEMNQFIMTIRQEIIRDCGCSVFFLHHPPKSINSDKKEKGETRNIILRGAGDLMAKCDFVMSLQPKDNSNTKKELIFEKVRIADKRNFPNMILSFNDAQKDSTKKEWILEKVITIENGSRKAELSTLILNEFKNKKGGFTRKEIGALLKINDVSKDKNFSQAWSLLTAKDLIKDSGIKKDKSAVFILNNLEP